MKKFTAIVLSVLMLASAFVYTVGAASEDRELFASVISFDNKDLSKISSDEADIKTIRKTYPAVVDTYDHILYHIEISGDGNHSVNIDASSLDFEGRAVNSVVLDSTSDLSRLNVIPVYETGEGKAAELVSYNGHGYYKFENPGSGFTGIRIEAKEAGFCYDMTEAFFCVNDYSAKFIIDNNVLPPTTPEYKLLVEEKGTRTAMNLSGVSKDVLYYDFDSTKWPTITVDENDKLYIIADGARRPAHSDTVSSAIVVTSEDGGLTYSDPKRVFNSILSDGDTSITYLGNGKMIVQVAPREGTQYLPGGKAHDIFMDKRHGGSAEDWMADHWDDATGEPIGGALGTYIDVLQHIHDTDPSYDMRFRSYVVSSDDYGETWNAERYKLLGTEGVDYTTEMKEYVDKYAINSFKGLGKIPVFTPHGAVQLSDGSLIEVGKVLDPVDIPIDEIGAYKSYDDGKTWEYAGRVQIPCDYHAGDFHEADMTETKDGVLIAGFRTFVVLDTFSYDKGRTWTTMRQTELEGSPPAYLTMPNGDIILTTDWRAANSRIYLWVSKDGGRTWSSRYEFKKGFDSMDMGYPDNAYLSDGTVVTCYYGNGDQIEATNWTYETMAVTPNGWAESEKGWVYFDGDGNMVKKQWQKDSRGWCYLDNNGFMVTGQSVKDKKGWCLVDESGYWVTKAGWNKVSGNWYYVGKDGYLVTNGWMKDSKGWCYLAANGLMRTNCSIQDTKGYCLLDKSGYWVTSVGWHKAGDNWYYVEKGGYLKTNGWMKDSKGWCFLDYEGVMKTNQAIQDSKGWCLVDASGYWVTAPGWHKANGDWYYVQKGGYLLTSNWMKDSKGWCYLDKTGVMLKNMAVKDSKGWALLDKEGYWDNKNPREVFVNSFYGGANLIGYYTIDKDGYLIMK